MIFKIYCDIYIYYKANMTSLYAHVSENNGYIYKYKLLALTH